MKYLPVRNAPNQDTYQAWYWFLWSLWRQVDWRCAAHPPRLAWGLERMRRRPWHRRVRGCRRWWYCQVYPRWGGGSMWPRRWRGGSTTYNSISSVPSAMRITAEGISIWFKPSLLKTVFEFLVEVRKRDYSKIRFSWLKMANNQVSYHVHPYAIVTFSSRLWCLKKTLEISTTSRICDK